MPEPKFVLRSIALSIIVILVVSCGAQIRPVVQEEGVTDIKTFYFVHKDIEWMEQRRFDRDEVAELFGVPDEIMGFGRDTYENFET